MRIQVGITPNRAAIDNAFALRLQRAGKPVRNALVTAQLDMLDMSMQQQAYTLTETSPGVYRRNRPRFVMVGHWLLGYTIEIPGTQADQAAGRRQGRGVSMRDLLLALLALVLRRRGADARRARHRGYRVSVLRRVVLGLILALVLAPQALADGDPASDILAPGRRARLHDDRRPRTRRSRSSSSRRRSRSPTRACRSRSR